MKLKTVRQFKIERDKEIQGERERVGHKKIKYKAIEI